MKNFMQAGPKAPAVKGKAGGASESSRTRLITGQGVAVKAAAAPKAAKDTTAADSSIVMPTKHPASTTTRKTGGTTPFVE